MSIKGLKAHINRLKKLSSQMVVKEVGEALFAAGERIATHAQISITAGAVSGKDHVPSKPGEPPNNDTGVLANNIETNQVAPLVVEVSSRASSSSTSGGSFGPGRPAQGGNANIARELEFGSSRVAARPYMRPARDANVKAVEKIVQKAVNKAVKKSRSGDS